MTDYVSEYLIYVKWKWDILSQSLNDFYTRTIVNVVVYSRVKRELIVMYSRVQCHQGFSPTLMDHLFRENLLELALPMHYGTVKSLFPRLGSL